MLLNDAVFFSDCWKQDGHQRPSFAVILDRLSNVTSEFLSTPPETFHSIRMNWKEEVQRKFLEFKDKESVSKFSRYSYSICDMLQMKSHKSWTIEI